MVRIRLMRMGKKHRPFYRVVVADARAPRDGRFIEILGYYDPMKEPPEIKIDAEKTVEWIKKGAQPTSQARWVLRKAGVTVS
ncbi:small subunit ribosomal protein S16 [Thermosulfidibacter takaii ABI70S6]|uniref:Small ribosomal subunit protein bS16 n=1 Tax=Thermosulfidibacter takaii (strain DSM 17441 / JCM 13301 / NBRC 103674 / ABI70S6) TaxID=1298851 RepID=A0A0S3QS89_THET7|nr:30S ribosomal protein S16 [Thermosulfidibacter takaii]BAT71203.1 small subunit ribosomal protein S16 [Thermosulfidibacter takaii ABI70S6]